MADNAKVVLTSLSSLINELRLQHANLQARCNALQAQIEHLEKEIELRNEKIENLTNELAQSEVRYKNLQISQRAELDTRQLQENKERFAKLVREIDKCISLLNE